MSSLEPYWTGSALIRGLFWSNMLKNGNRVIWGVDGGVYIPEEARSPSPSRGACVRTAAFEERAGLAPTRGLNHSLDKATFITLQAVSSSSH